MIFLKNFCPKIKEGSLGTVEVVKVGEKKHEELEGKVIRMHMYIVLYSYLSIYIYTYIYSINKCTIFITYNIHNIYNAYDIYNIYNTCMYNTYIYIYIYI